MSLGVIISAIEIGLIFSILACGLFITFKIMNFPDLTVDGSFTLGLAIGCVCTLAGYPVLGLLLAFAGGSLAGLFTGLLHTKMKIQYILAGIITMTGLYSINLKVAGNTPNFSLFSKETIFTKFSYITNDIFGMYEDIILLFLVVIFVSILLYLFLKTQTGLALRATGDNEDMVKASSINTDNVKLLGLSLANGIVALAAAIYGQYQLFFDIQLGIGMMVIGITGIIIGEAIFGSKSILIGLVSLCVGSIIYRIVLSYALSIGLAPNDWKLLSALLVAVVISLPTIKSKLQKGGK